MKDLALPYILTKPARKLISPVLSRVTLKPYGLHSPVLKESLLLGKNKTSSQDKWELQDLGFKINRLQDLELCMALSMALSTLLYHGTW